MLKHCSLCWWFGTRFRLISPESKTSKWKYEFKFLYLKFRNRIKSDVHSSNRKLKTITDIHELRRRKSWSGTSSHIIKEIWRIFVFKKQKSHTHQEKKNNFYLFITFFFHQTSKNKKITGNIIHDSSEVILLWRRTVWVISLPTLTLTEREDKMKNKLTKFLKTCNKLTKIHINNIMAKNTKQ